MYACKRGYLTESTNRKQDWRDEEEEQDEDEDEDEDEEQDEDQQQDEEHDKDGDERGGDEQMEEDNGSGSGRTWNRGIGWCKSPSEQEDDDTYDDDVQV